jgi:hypothetical protein
LAHIEETLLEVKLVGADNCWRYELMREIVTEEDARIGAPSQLIEETEVEGIMNYQMLNLPLLILGEGKSRRGIHHRAKVQKHIVRI